MNKWTGQDVERMLVNPFYAITIDPDLAGEHKPAISKRQWIEANLRLIDQIGAEAWLKQLLAVLEGDFPRHPEADPDSDGAPAVGYK